jgi:hypothetical protein
MRITFVHGAAVVAGSALAAGLCLVAPSAQASAIPAPAGADPAPAAGAASYLAAQRQANDILRTTWGQGPGEFYDDYGLTIDAGFALDAVGGQAAALTAMTNALVASSSSYYNDFSGTGAAAKLSAFLQSQGRSGALVDDLVAAVEAHIEAVDTDYLGRLVDADDPATEWDDDFNSPLTQAFAVATLHDAGSSLAASALAFDLRQQCAAGFFREAFSLKADTEQGCTDDAPTGGSVDVTGLTVLMLQDQKAAPAVSASITNALDWLVSQQGADGSFNGGNANSTGVAGWALGVGGRTAAAAKAAQWLRGQQLVNAGSCVAYAAKDDGAVALDAAALVKARSGPLGAVDTSVNTRATTQALPALLWAPGGAAAGATTLTGPADFVKAGSTQSVGVTGAPGNTLCVTVGSTSSRVVLDAAGTATIAVAMPKKTADVTVSAVDAGGETDSVTVAGLAKATFRLKGRTSVHLGAKLTVKVTGLAPRESAVVTFLGKKVKKQANAKGVVKVKLKATRLGTSKIKVKGEFRGRKGVRAVTVTR